MNYIIAIDLGATKTIVGLIKNRNIVKKIRFRTSRRGANSVIKDLIKYINLIKIDVERTKIKAIIIGVAGYINHEKGIVVNAPNINGFNNIKLRNILRKKLKLPINLKNDAELQALGEYSQYKKCSSLFYISIGTGFGTTMIYQGKSFPLEFGHSIVVPNGVKCTCGNYGCFEAYISGHGIMKRYFELYKKKLNPLEILELGKKGDKEAQNFLNEIGNYLGIGLTNIVNIFNPNIIVINGGMSNLVNYILKKAKKILLQNKIIKYKGKILISKLHEDAFLFGTIYFKNSLNFYRK